MDTDENQVTDRPTEERTRKELLSHGLAYLQLILNGFILGLTVIRCLAMEWDAECMIYASLALLGFISGCFLLHSAISGYRRSGYVSLAFQGMQCVGLCSLIITTVVLRIEGFIAPSIDLLQLIFFLCIAFLFSILYGRHLIRKCTKKKAVAEEAIECVAMD